MIMSTNDETDLKALVDQQVEMILRHDTVVKLSAVIAAVAQNIGVAPDRNEIGKILDAHPHLMKAGEDGVELATYKRRI
jgi:hypothetical protein